MTKYRSRLPQLEGGTFLTDGGLETTLLFQRGIDLPLFASFPLVDDEQGRQELTEYYEAYLAIASEKGLGFILDTPTWRANPDWAAQLGYDLEDLAAINRRSVAYVASLRELWERPGRPIVLNGVLGPRGDGYKAGAMTVDEAQSYHAFQIGAFAGSEIDMVSAITMNNVEEAIGIARAASGAALPCVISFTVETDGRLASGMALREAVEETDRQTGGTPVYYMVNCAHPTHFEDALNRGERWIERIGGVRANASTKSHAELDDATEIDIGDPADLARRYSDLRRSYPTMRVLGGCCGTDHRHVNAICEACLPVAAE
ncbi:homocysteine S-methyltransferase family protein [Pseudorhizobium flavum]|uniref:homocysteine S-methyltransferase family protein n=1 Tax=Pseudorhizobium flavum TaxID=1335061 RepID=UPI00249399DA|nr:homocysteine S-methyltransferase family protein [Pseudorhizobium flavum]